MTDLKTIDFDTMKPEEFESVLPDLFASGNGKVSQDPRLQKFLSANPDCAALVSDLETIAEHARSLFEPVEDPSDAVWSNIQSKLREEDGMSFDGDIDASRTRSKRSTNGPPSGDSKPGQKNLLATLRSRCTLTCRMKSHTSQFGYFTYPCYWWQGAGRSGLREL